MLDKLNAFLQKYIAVFTPLSVILGVIFEGIGHQLTFLVVWIFAFMTFSGSLNMKFKDIQVFKRHPWLIVFVLLFLHMLMPIWAYALAHFSFNDHLLTVGFVMFAAVPTGVTSMFWIQICKGNLPLGLAIILIDTLLAPFVMPLLLYIVSGEHIQLDTLSLIVDLLYMIVLPTIAGVVANELTKGALPKKTGKKLAPINKICVFLVVGINSSAIAPFLKTMNWELASVLLLVLFIAVTGYLFAYMIGRFFLKNNGQTIAFLYTGGMRNITLGVVVATTYFPTKVAMPVVFGMLFQQALASLFSKLFNFKT